MDRQHDLNLIDGAIASGKLSSEQIAKLKHQKERIRKEMDNPHIREMREKLIRAHKEGNIEEVNDIRDFIKDKPKYNNSL